jgi:hypothetical protein
VNFVRSSDAPVAINRAGSTPGADVRNLPMAWLINAAWAEETVKAPPTVWKTVISSALDGKSSYWKSTYSRDWP